MRKGEVRSAAEILRAILARVERGELTAAARVRARLEGAATAFEALAKRQAPASTGQKKRLDRG